MIDGDADRFFDPDGSPGAPPTVQLTRITERGTESWRLDRRIGYRSRRFDDPIVVPRDPSTFTTDLTSVPAAFTWLVPRTGDHLQAALVHDALIPPFSVDGQPDWIGPPTVSRLDADLVFREAMADSGTPPVRRWLVWSAVSLPTAWYAGRFRAIVAYLTLVAIAVIGWFATLDLFDQGEWLPWMADRTWPRELVFGGAMAVVTPLVLSALWPRRLRVAGAITGIALAALLHVTAVIAGLTLGYQIVEYRLAAWGGRHRWSKLAATAGGAAVVTVTIWMSNRY